MVRLRLSLLAVLLTLVAVAVPARGDHAPPSGAEEQTPPPQSFQSGGPNAKWESLGTVFTGNPQTDLDFFSSRGSTFAAVGTLAAGANGGGVTFARLSGPDGKVAPQFVKSHPSASCVSNPAAALSLQHDIEATPKPAGVPLNTANDLATLGDAQLILDATDAGGRCHDQGLAGVAASGRGGLEIIDVSEGVENAKEIGLTSQIGEAHTVNVDPKRPHIAYAVTSDSVGVDEKGVRANENETTNAAGQSTTSFALDGFEVVDLRSCMYFPPGTTLEAKRASCRPQVYRYRYPSAAFAQGHSADDESGPNRGIFACHEVELYPDDRLTCGSGAVSLMLDMSGAFDDMGTPNDFTDDKPRGTPLPCKVRDTTTLTPALQTKAKITDCVTGTQEGKDVDLRVPNWKKIGSPSLQGVKHLGTAQHIGRAATGSRAKFDSTQDIDFAHESELSASGRYLISSDERGGGVAPPGAACDSADAIKEGNGGLNFYAVDRLRTTFTGKPEEAWASYAKTSKGAKAIYRAPIRTGAQGTICTAHVFQQIPGQNRIFAAWYSQGTQVIDFTENPDGTVDLKEAGYFIPANANEWSSGIFRAERNPDGTFSYYGAAGDFNLSQGRNAIDLYKVTLPPPPTPRIDAAETPPAAQGTATIPEAAPTTGSGAQACAATSGLRSVKAKPRRGGLRFSFTGARSRPVDVEVFRLSRGTRIHPAKSVKLFRQRTKAFSWKARGVRSGVYVVRFRVRGNQGRALAQRVALVRGRSRFLPLAPIERRAACDEVDRVALIRPVFGGRKGFPLKVAVRLAVPAQVEIDLVDRRGRVVRDTAKRVVANRVVRIPIGARRVRRGFYRVRVLLRYGQTQETVTLGIVRL